MATVVLDIFESPQFEEGLRRWGLEVVRINMVPTGLADITWIGLDGKRFTQEHKTMQQVCTEMGHRLDDQLRKHTQHADDVSLVVDGIALPHSGGGIDLYHKPKGKNVMFKVKRHHADPDTQPSLSIGYEALQAYIWQLEHNGIGVYTFPDIDAMCLGVASQVLNTLKPGQHQTLRHYTKTRPITWQKDPHIETLMGLGGETHIGEITAKKILAKFKTPYSFFTASGDDAQSVVGEATFHKAMKAIGRNVY